MKSLILALLVFQPATPFLSTGRVENDHRNVPAACVDPRPEASIAERRDAVTRSADPIGQFASVFEENAGQSESEVEYLARGRDSTVFFTRLMSLIAFHGAPRDSNRERHVPRSSWRTLEGIDIHVTRIALPSTIRAAERLFAGRILSLGTSRTLMAVDHCTFKPTHRYAIRMSTVGSTRSTTSRTASSNSTL